MSNSCVSCGDSDTHYYNEHDEASSNDMVCAKCYDLNIHPHPRDYFELKKKLANAKPKQVVQVTDAEMSALRSGATSDGSTAIYYELPKDATELQHLISHKNMNAQVGEMFRECYRYGEASHCDMLRGIKKILFYANAEKERLEKYVETS